jgi:hypothetical protein
LSGLSANHPAERQITLQRRPYLVRLLEIAYGDVDHADHLGDAVEELTWTNKANHQAMPRIDGALALYDVRTRTSVEQVTEMLGEYPRDAEQIGTTCGATCPGAQKTSDGNVNVCLRTPQHSER